MDTQATARYIRISPRKMLLLVDSIKNQRPQQAVETLTYLHKSGAADLKKVIASALANAKNKNVAALTDLEFKHIDVLPGSAMKRFRAVSRGMAHTYKKRMSHVTVVLRVNQKAKAEVSSERTKTEPALKGVAK
jgi:large subunit ribosomal protein L22